MKPDKSATPFIRITGFEAYPTENTLSIRTVDDSGNSLILLGTPNPVNCAAITPNPNVTAQPTATPNRTTVPVAPSCGTNEQNQPNECPLVNNPNLTDEDIVAFTLACEAGLDFEDSVNIAYVIRNRMKSGLYRGTARYTVSLIDQFDCYLVGARKGTGLDTLADIPQNFRVLARMLINLLPIPYQPATQQDIRWYGLYTIGVGSTAINRDQFTDQQMIDLASFQRGCTNGLFSPRIFVGYEKFAPVPPNQDPVLFDFTTVIFSDALGCK
jgi:hypothetical protein